MIIPDTGTQNSSSPDETLGHGRDMARHLRAAGPVSGSPLILLSGPLGAGKTLWTRGLAEGLGIGSEVHSPSFSLMNVYQSAQGSLYHFDLYRVSCLEEVVDLGLFEVITDGNPCVVEWADRVPDLWNWRHWSVTITPTGENTRTIAWQRAPGRESA